MKQFINLYPVSKTLRFELKPIGKTLENIEKGNLLKEDAQRAEDYKKVKCFIDEYHKQFIKSRLWNFELPLRDEGKNCSLEEYQALYELKKRNEKEESDFTEVKDRLRAIIVKQLTAKGSAYDRIFKKELIREDLLNFLQDESEKEIVRQFADFTTYFRGFYENRENLYSAEAKSTAIAYRLIHQNLPKFMDNIRTFSKIAQTSVSAHFDEIFTQWQDSLNVNSLEEFFSLNNFTRVLTQEHIEMYNYIIGKRILEDGTEIKGINEYVNLYNQNQKDRKNRLPFLVPLYKQILSDREKLTFLAEEFDTDEKMLEAVKETYASLYDKLMGDENESLRSLLMNIRDYDLSQIHICNNLSLTDISQRIFGKYDVFTKGIKEQLTFILPRKKKETDEKYEERLNKVFKSYKSFSIADLDQLPHPEIEEGRPHNLEEYFIQLGAIHSNSCQKENIFAQIENAYTVASPILQRIDTGGNLSQNKDAVSKIKNLLDALKDLQRFIKPLLGSGEESEKDGRFYGAFQVIWDELEIVTPLYNKVRNWLTKRPYSTEKIKLNFGNSQLLGGWDVNKEPDCTGIILCKEGEYYLGIINKKNNHIFERYDIALYGEGGEYFDKIEYKLLPGPNKMLPKVFFSKSREDEFAPSPSLIKKYKCGTHKKGANFSLDDCHALIDFFKQSISKHDDWSKFGFTFSDTLKYEDISGFYREVEKQGYHLSTRKISSFFVHQMVDEGKLYLFRIWNKDFSEYSKGTPNLHTLYWKMLFDERNLRDVVYKLNGQAEVFFRKSSISQENRTIHPAHMEIANKNAMAEKKTSLFDYDIVKDRRYTLDKFQFHVPITINFKAKGLNNINPLVIDTIREGGFSHIIGIDRGERHLLYLSLIDLNGRIVKQLTLNQIVNEYNGHQHPTDYRSLLVKREGDRTNARRSWDTIERIRELKEGYLSQVIYVITKMMVEYNAIVVLEDLNSGFIRGRQKIERQVYEKFEKMLIDKLNCYIDKKKDPESEGGMLYALQLANKFESFSKIGKQSGCIFYIPSWNTSKIDPVTGFVNLLDTRYESMKASKVFFSRFDRIIYNAQKDWFEFSFDYNNFHKKAEGTQTQWTVCSHGTRIHTFRNPMKNNQWDDEEIVLTEKYKALFEKYGIDYKENLKDAIQGSKEAKFYQELMALMKLLMQMRNSKTNTDIDYMLSPVSDKSGNFYDSRICGDSLPENADANGAYNIARKGLMLVRSIMATPKDKKPSLVITNKEWLYFAQTKPYLYD
ncbi:MAG: type V CRISPR-associated protein Cas12a/Cpf1 [Prevotella sp.]|nr:type V CRISPR-associated protein Cas12a/Cpf1 [Prevotella sp.]